MTSPTEQAAAKGKGKRPPFPESAAKGKGKGPPLPGSTPKGKGKGPPRPTGKVDRSPILINVLFLDGRTETLQVLTSDTVHMLKDKLSSTLEYSAYRQTLIFDGFILPNAAVLSDCGVVDGSTLNICIKTPNPLNVDDEVASVRANLFDELTKTTQRQRQQGQRSQT